MSTKQSSQPAPARVRGTLVGARLAFIASRWGASQQFAVIEGFAPEEQRRLQSVAMEGDWFDYSVLETIDERIRQELAAQDAGIARDLGAFTAEHGLKRVRTQTGELGAEKIVERLGRLSLQLQDFSHFTFEEVGLADDNHGSAYVFEYTRPVSTFFCESMLAYYRHLLELLGLRVISASETECVDRGGSRHRYEIWWSPVPLREEEGPDPRTVRMYRQAATAERPGHGTRSLEVPGFAPRPRRWRVGFMGLLIAALAAFWLGTDGYAWYLEMTSPPPEKAGEPVLEYRCSGDVEATVRFERPDLVVKNIQAVPGAQIEVVQDGRFFRRAGRDLIAHGSYLIDLRDFTDEIGMRAPRIEAPTLVRITSATDPSKGCECVLEGR